MNTRARPTSDKPTPVTRDLDFATWYERLKGYNAVPDTPRLVALARPIEMSLGIEPQAA